MFDDEVFVEKMLKHARRNFDNLKKENNLKEKDYEVFATAYCIGVKETLITVNQMNKYKED